MNTKSNTFLFSIDLEDVRDRLPEGAAMPERCPTNVKSYLEFLSRHRVHCTFFTLGAIARRYPELIKEIVDAGHEIACHSSNHISLDRLTPESFRQDIEECLHDLEAAGAKSVTGFRAPYFSLTEKSSWAYEILDELGFTYSSSVVVANNPIYGWPTFEQSLIASHLKIKEIPITLTALPGLNVPYAGGVYFRCLPRLLIRYLFKRDFKTGKPITGYFHPYDIDTQQQRCDWPEFNGNRLFHWLIYRNRHQVFDRLEQVMKQGARITTYADYVEAG